MTEEELAADAAGRLTGRVQIGQRWRYVDGRVYRVEAIGFAAGEGRADPTAFAEMPEEEGGDHAKLVDPRRGRVMFVPLHRMTSCVSCPRETPCWELEDS